MKTEIKEKQPNGFKPIELRIIIESKAELKELRTQLGKLSGVTYEIFDVVNEYYNAINQTKDV